MLTHKIWNRGMPRGCLEKTAYYALSSKNPWSAPGWVLFESGMVLGATHSTKISGNFGPKLNGSVRSNRKSFEKSGPPFEVVVFSRSDRSEFWLNGSRPLFLTLPTPTLSHGQLRTGTKCFGLSTDCLPIAMFQWRLLFYSPGQRGIYLGKIINRRFSYVILGDEKNVSKAYYFVF